MSFNKILVYCIVFATALTSTAFAEIRLPNIIASNMVLQQKSDATVWGWSDPAEKIYIITSWDNKKDSVVADGNAKWKIKLSTPAAGGPYTITLKGSNTIILENIMIGEVWVCSGQSNMEWGNRQGLKQMADEIPNSANDNLRLFHIPKTTAEYPQENTEGTWKVSGSDALKEFSAVGYFFAKALQKKLNVPVGIIHSSWGGTPAETWTPETAVNNDPALASSAKLQNQVKWWPVFIGSTYNAMIYPLTNFSIAGVIWYQGESNVVMPSTYGKLFTTMIKEWRKSWQKDFPFYFVQLAPYNYPKYNVGNLIREQQTKSLTTPNTGMVVITDLVEDVKNIHPTNKKDVALRLANYALAETYKQNVGIYKSPMLNHMEIKGNNALLYFDNAPNGFKLNRGKLATEFYIAGADKNFLPATVKIENQKLVVSNPKIKEPVAVRFSFSNTAISNIFSKEGLPIAPFRTDDWEVDVSKVK